MTTEQYIGLDKLLEQMEPQHKKNIELIKIALKGITEYAVDIKINNNVDDGKVNDLRDFVEVMTSYWLSSEGDNCFIPLDEFDDAISNAQNANEVQHSERQSTLTGLLLYSQDMIISLGVDGKEYIFECNRLMKEMAQYWNIDVTKVTNQISQDMLDIMIQDCETTNQGNINEIEHEPKWEMKM